MGASITGRWLSPDATPIASSAFTVQRYSSTPVSVLGEADTVVTNGAGEFTLNLLTGTYLVTGPNAGGSLLIKVPASTGSFSFSSLVVENS